MEFAPWHTFRRLVKRYQGDFNVRTFVIRAESNLRCKRVYFSPVDRTTGLICDQQVRLTVFDATSILAFPLANCGIVGVETVAQAAIRPAKLSKKVGATSHLIGRHDET